MATITTELVKKLDDDGEPLSKRLCLAQNVFQSSQLPVQRKEEAVIGWLCKVASKIRKKSKRESITYLPENAPKLWQTLRSCVSSVHMQRLGFADIRPSVKTNIVKVLSKHMEAKDWSLAERLSLVECVTSVLEASSFQRHFRTNVAQCMNFAGLLLDSLSGLGGDHITLCVKGVSALQGISRQTILRNELCMSFLDVALLPLIKLLSSQGNQPSPLSTEIYRCIQQVLFPKNSLDFPRFFSEIFKENKKVADPTANLPCTEEQHPVPFKLLKLLRDSKDILDSHSYVNLFSVVFRAFVASYKANAGPMVFKMTVTLGYLVGLEVEHSKCTVPYFRLRESLTNTDADRTTLSVRVFHGMAFILAQWGISLNGEMYGTRFLNWLQMLVEGLFPLSPSLSVNLPFMELISTLVKLNPLIVEPHTKNILEVIFVKPLSDEEKPLYTTLVSNLLAMFMKLNRIPNFMNIFLVALKDGFQKQHDCSYLPSERNVWLPSKTCEELTRYATVMPSSSSITSLNALLDQLLMNCLEPFQQEGEQNSFMESFVECVCELICAILKGVRMLEQCTALHVRERYCALMKKLQTCLSSFGLLLLKLDKSKPVLMFSFLNLAHHWAAEALLVEQYAEVGREDLLASIGTQLKEGCQIQNDTGILSYMHPYLSSANWSNIYKLVDHIEEERCKDALLKLDLQLLSAIQMFTSSESNSCVDVAKLACKQMVHKLKLLDSASMDRSLVSDVALMAPLLSFSELLALSDSLAAYLINNQSEQPMNEMITLLLEDRLVACGLICSTLSSLRRVLKVCKRKRDETGGKLWRTAKAVLGKLDAEILLQGETRPSSDPAKELNCMMSSMAALAEKALLAIDGDQEQSTGTECDLIELSQHIHFLRSLPLPYLSVSSQAVVFISLLSVALDCSPLPTSVLKDSLMKEIYDHLLLGLLERGIRLGPKLEGCIDYGILVNGLAYVTTHHNVAQRLLELLLSHALHGEQSQDQLLEKLNILHTKSWKQEPEKESLLLGTLLMQDLSGKRLRKMRSQKPTGNSDESAHLPLNKLKKARQKLVKSFESLVAKQLVAPEDVLHAFALTLDFNVKFDEEIDNLTPHLEKYCKSAVLFLDSDSVPHQKAAEALVLAVLRHRSKLQDNIPNNFIKDVWSLLISYTKSTDVLTTVVFECASQDEMSFIINDLLLKTRSAYESTNSGAVVPEKLSPNMIRFWQVLLACQNLPAFNSEISLKAVRLLFERLALMKKLPQQQLLEFLHAALSSSKLTMDMEMVDMCLLILHEISLPPTAKDFVPIAQQYLSVLSALLLQRSSLALDSIPSFLQMLQLLVKQLANESKQRPELSRADGALLAGVAFGVEKLVNALTKPDKKKSFKRVAAYFIADILAIFETVTLCSSVKVHFQNMVHALLSIIDEYSIKFLLRTMPPASTEIFKSLLDSYKKFHRFSGRV